MTSSEKQVDWVGTSLDDLKSFPERVRQSFGFDLHLIQNGLFPESAKPLKSKGLSGVYELKRNYSSNTYRTVYIAKLGDKIYVLHCFQKKSTTGKKTPQREIDVIIERLKLAKEDSKKAKK